MKSITFDKLKPHLIAIGIMVILSAIYFNPQLSGKVLSQDDSAAFKQAVNENLKYEKQEGRTILWTNSMFGGMPMYQIHPSSDGNFIRHFNKPLRAFLTGPIGIFIGAFLSMYIMIIALGGDFKLGLVGAIAFGLTTNNIVLWDAGHATKVVALSYLSLILGGIILIFRKRFVLGSVLFTLGLALDIGANHIQMTYYFAICLIGYWLMESFVILKNKRFKDFFKINGILAICAILAIATTATNYLATFEYQKDTMRGDPILKKESVEAKSSSETEGLEWTYATNWSNGGIDLLASMIPGVAGGSSAEPILDNGVFAKNGVKKDARVQMYWGDLGSTSGPAYFGAILCFLFVLGAFILKGPLKWWLVGAVVFTMMLSMGRHLPDFYRLFFDYFPLFNKFRAPNSILGVTSFFVATMGVLTLKKVYEEKTEVPEILKYVKISGIITGGLCLIIALFGTGLFDMSWEMDSRLAEGQQGQGYVNALLEDRASLLSKDAWRSFFFIALAFGVIWFYLKNKINQKYFYVLIGLFVLIDLWGVDKRYLNDASFQPKRTQKASFAMRPVDQQILNDKDLSYRVFDLSVNTFNSAFTSYFHQSIGGYSAAKLQRYQDIIDNHITKYNMGVFNMLNTRYFISQKQELQYNNKALGNAWFVEEIKKVKTPNEEIDALTNIKADSVAIVLDDEFSNYVGDFQPTKDGEISLVKFVPDRLEYKSSSKTDQFAVFSEIWYGPDKGWKAYIDNKEVPFVRANYVLRGLKIPAGSHKVEFKFEPQSYSIGKMLATVSSIIILLLMGFGIYKYRGQEE